MGLAVAVEDKDSLLRIAARRRYEQALLVHVHLDVPLKRRAAFLLRRDLEQCLLLVRAVVLRIEPRFRQG